MFRAARSSKYKSIYSKKHRRNGPLKVTVLILGAIVVLFLGYSIEPTVADLITGKFKVSSGSSSSPSHASGSSSQASSGSSSSSPSSSKPAQEAALKGIYLPERYLSDMGAVDSTISAAKQAGVNLAVVQLKGTDGIIAYSSKIQQAQGEGMVAPNAPSAAAIVQELTKNGITPAAAISCFRDPNAPKTMFNAAVLYANDHSQRWLDNGNRWLNPYSPLAQQYIIDLAKEAVSLGFKQIYLDNVEFPLYDAKAWYGDGLPAKDAALRAFVDEATKQITAAGGKVSVIMPGSAAAGIGDQGSGQVQSIYGFTSDYLSPNLSPSLFGANANIGGVSLAKPDLTPGDTVTAAAGYLKTQAGTRLNVTVPFIQAFTNTALGDGNFKQYAAADINAEITALKNAGITNYVLYSPDGNYNLSGVSSS